MNYETKRERQIAFDQAEHQLALAIDESREAHRYLRAVRTITLDGWRVRSARNRVLRALRRYGSARREYLSARLILNLLTDQSRPDVA